MIQVLEPRVLLSAAFPEFVDPNPNAGNQFGHSVVALSSGNVVITSPFDDAGGTDAGAVYLFNGATGALISTLTGSTSSDQVGIDGVTALSNGNYVVRSQFWDGAAVNVGAVTFGSGTTGISGAVSASNSLVGSTSSDQVGNSGVTALSNGNYVVSSQFWDGAAANVGAVTWGSGTTGISGAVSSTNSAIGLTATTNLRPVVVDDSNSTFFGRFRDEVGGFGGRVRVGSQVDGFAVSPAVNLSVSAATGTETGRTQITVTATAASAVSGAQTVTIAVTGTGITSGDFTLSNATITIPDGMTTGTVTFTIKDDLANDDGETATLTISSPSAGITLGTTLSQNIAITDNDDAAFATYGTPDDNLADSIRVVLNSGNVEIRSVPGDVLLDSRTFASLSGGLAIQAADGEDDMLTVDIQDGNPIPSGGLTFHGGTGSNDSLRLAGGATTTVTHTFTNANDGSVTLAGPIAGTISYTGLEPITDNLNATNRVFTFNGGAETIALSDAGGDQLLIDSDLAESVTFASPSGTLTINAGTGDDTINIAALGTTLISALVINGDANTDTINLNGDITFASGKSLVVTAESLNTAASADFVTSGTGIILISADDVAINATSTLVSANTVTLKPQTAARAINVGTETGGSLSLTDTELDRITSDSVNIGDANSGTLTVSAAITHGNRLSLTTGGGIAVNQAVTMAANKNLAATSSSTTAGIDLNTATADLATSGTGTIALTAARNILLSSSSSLSSVDGNITLNANQQPSATAGDFKGIWASGASISTSGLGSVTLNGRGGDGSSGLQDGVALTGATVSGATTTVTGTGGASVGNSNYGLRIASSSVVTSSGGNVVVTGTGGGISSSGTDAGVFVFNSSTITAGGTGTVSVTGTGGSGSGTGNSGVELGSGLLTGTITSNGGAISVVGTGTTGSGVQVTSAGNVTAINSGTISITGSSSSTTENAVALFASPSLETAGGTISVIADSLGIGGVGGTIVSGTGATTLVQRTAGTLIRLGGGNIRTGNPVTLGFFDVELDEVTAGTLNIGNSNSGTVTFVANITHATNTNINLTTGANNNIDFSTFSLDAGSGGDVTLTTSSSGAITTGDNTGTDLTADDVTLTSGSGGIANTTNFLRLAATTVVASTLGNSGIRIVELDSVTIGSADLNAGTGTTRLGGGTFLTGSGRDIVGNVIVASGATLGGTGSVTGTLTTQSGGNVAPGNSPGILNSGNVTLVSGSNFNVEIDGTTVGTQYDQLNVTGTVDLDGANLVLTLGFTPANGNSFVIVNNDSSDAVTGTFMVGGNSIADGGSFTVSGTRFVIDYTSGSNSNDVTLTVQNNTLTATIVGNDLVLEDIDSTGRANVLSVSRSGANLVISDTNEQFATAIGGAVLSNGNKTITIPATALGTGGKIIFRSQGGSDSLSVDVSTDLGFDVQFEGGSGTSDSLTLAADTVTSVTHAFTNANDGSVTIVDGGTRVITYTGLEPITDNLSATDRVFTFNGGAETITLTDNIAADGMTLIDSTLGESVYFTNPTNSVTINAGSNDDTVTITSVDAGFNAALTINGDAGADTVNLNGDITFASGRSLIVNAETLNTGASADLITSGAGVITITADDVALNATSTLQSASTVTIVTQTAARAINLGSQVAGSLSLTDEELDRATANKLQVGHSSSGAITISADISPANVTVLHLTSGSAVGGGMMGGVVVSDLAVSAAGTVDLRDTTTDVNNVAIFTSAGSIDFVDANGLTVTSVDGVNGFEASGSVDLTVSAGNLNVADTAATVDINGSALIITLNGNDAVFANAVGSMIGNSSIPVSLVSDEMNLVGNITANSITLAPRNAGELIDLGSNPAQANTLELSDAELDLITATSFRIGRNDASAAGNITLTAPISVNRLILRTGGGVVDANSSGADITSLSLTLRTATGAGFSGADQTLETDVTSLGFLNTTSGDVLVSDSSGLSLTNTDGFSTSQNSAGSVNLRAGTNDISVTNDIVVGGAGSLTLNAVSGNVTISDPLTSNTGDITLQAGGNILSSGTTASVTTTSGNIFFLADNDSTSGGTMTFARPITLGSGTATFRLSDTDGSIGGVISGTGNVIKNGSGTLSLSQINTYTGTTTVSAGRLNVNGSLDSGSAVTVGNTATLGGTGTVAGTVTVASGGNVAPGNSPGILNSGHVTLISGSNFDVEVNGSTTAGTDYDQLNVIGTVNVTGATLAATGSITSSPGQTVVLINNDSNDLITGTFSGLAEGATVTINGINFKISYVGGTDNNDIVLTETVPPVVDLNAGGEGRDVTTAFTEPTAVLIAPVATLTDVDSANLTSLIVTLTARPDGNAVESLSLNAAATTAASGLTVSYTAATGVLSITGSATKATYQTILQGVRYGNTSDTPTTTSRSITVVTHDGTNPSATQTVTLTVAASNDAPVLATAGAITYTENDPATAIATGITVSDVDSATLDSATVTITNFVVGQDVLAFINDGLTMGNITINTNAGGVLTLTSALATATTAHWQAALRAVTYANTSDTPTTTQRSVTFVVNDGTSNSNTLTSTINITATPEEPVNLSVSTSAGSEQAGTVITVTASTASPVVGDQTVDLAVTGLNVTGADFILSNTTITILNGQTSGSVTFTIVNDAIAEADELATLTISNPSSKLQLGTTVSRNVSIADSFKATVLGFDTAVNFTEGNAALLLDADTTVSDVDSPNFNGGSLTVYLNDALELSDRLAIQHQGNAAGEIGISGANVSFGGTLIGTFTGGSGVTPLVISFNANATPAAVQALSRRLTYRNVAENSSGAQRVVRLAMNDGDGATRTVHKVVNVLTVNDVPVIGAFDTMINYIDNTAAVQLDFNATVVDVDSDNLNTGTLTATLTAGSESTDRLEIRHVGNGINQIGVSGTNVTYQGTVIGTFVGGSGSTPLVVTFNASSSPFAAYYLLRNITFRSVAPVPSTAPRTVQVSVNDGDSGTSNLPTKTITVTAVNDAAIVAGFDTAITYTEGNAPLLLDTDVTVTDADSVDFNSGSMTVYLNNAAEAADRLAIRHEGTGAGQIGLSGANVTFGGVTIGTFTGGTGTTPLVIAFNLNSSPAAAQALARNLTYRNVSTTPSTAQRVVRVSLADGDGATRLVSKLVNVIATP